MTGMAIRAVALVLCIGAVGCATYNPATGQYQTDPGLRDLCAAADDDDPLAEHLVQRTR